MDKFCENCGYKLNANDKFCENCGSKIEETIIEDTDKSTNNGINNENINHKGSNALFCIGGIIVAIILLIAIGGLSHSDIVDIQGVDMAFMTHLTPTIEERRAGIEYYSGGKLNLNVVPLQDIFHVKEMRLENVVLTLDNGSKISYDSASLGINWNDVGLPKGDADLYEGSSYDLKVFFRSERPITHISGDLMADTTSKKDVFCSHLDSDIVCSMVP